MREDESPDATQEVSELFLDLRDDGVPGSRTDRTLIEQGAESCLQFVDLERLPQCARALPRAELTASVSE